MNVQLAARRWAETWQRAWPAKVVDDIAVLYGDGATYRSSALADPEPGGALAYLRRQFAVEESVHCRFAEPIVTGHRAAVEWWASWSEAGEAVTLAGVTVLRFAPDGTVTDHVDYWLHVEGRQDPYPAWGS